MFKHFKQLCIATTLLQLMAFAETTLVCNSYDYQNDSSCSDDDHPWYGIIGTGYAWSLKAGIENPDPSFWDEAIQGYNNSLGGSPFLTFGFGRKFLSYLRTDFSYTYFQTFHYVKFQTGISSTPGFTGDNRTRFFDLDNQNILFNLSFYPEKHFYFTFWSLDISPFIGGGIGVGFNRVTNFHTVGASHSVGSTTSIGHAASQSSFAWQGLGGLRFHPINSSTSFDIGYHYYDGGTFKGPTNIYVNDAVSLGEPSFGTAWKGKLRTHQISGTFNLSF